MYIYSGVHVTSILPVTTIMLIFRLGFLEGVSAVFDWVMLWLGSCVFEYVSCPACHCWGSNKVMVS